MIYVYVPVYTHTHIYTYIQIATSWKVVKMECTTLLVCVYETPVYPQPIHLCIFIKIGNGPVINYKHKRKRQTIAFLCNDSDRRYVAQIVDKE